jgi:hypothetical protein
VTHSEEKLNGDANILLLPPLLCEIRCELIHDEAVRGGEIDSLHLPAQGAPEGRVELLKITISFPHRPLKYLFFLHLGTCES